MIDQCAICDYIQDAIKNLSQISYLIDLSCRNQKRKKDFGLEKSFIQKEIATIEQMFKYHQYFHSTGGESLNDSDSLLNYDQPKPKKFRDHKNDC